MKVIGAAACSAIAATGLMAYGIVIAQEVPAGAVVFTPSNAKWAATPSGGESAVIYGNPGKPERYLMATKFPPNFVLKPHSHPDERHYTVISGTWYIGFGTEFDETKLIALPAGSFYTEPANAPHFVATKADGAIVQLGGSGPTRQIWVNPADDPSKKK